MSDQTPPPSEEPESVPTPEPVVYTPAPDAPAAYTPAPAVAVPVAPANGMGTMSLIFGVVGFFCLPFIGAILAIVFGRIGINKAKRGEATNGGVAKAGFWVGIVGLVIHVIVTIGIIIVAVFAVNTISTNTNEQVNSETGLSDGQYQMDPDASFVLNDRCGFTGDPYDSTMTVVKQGVTVSGSGVTQCGSSSTDVTVVRFDVVDGVAKILQVQ